MVLNRSLAEKLAGHGPFDEGVLARLQRPRGRLLEGLGRIGGVVEIIANGAPHAVRPFATRIEHAVVGALRRPAERFLVDSASLEQFIEPFDLVGVSLLGRAQLVGQHLALGTQPVGLAFGLIAGFDRALLVMERTGQSFDFFALFRGYLGRQATKCHTDKTLPLGLPERLQLEAQTLGNALIGLGAPVGDLILAPGELGELVVPDRCRAEPQALDHFWIGTGLT